MLISGFWIILCHLQARSQHRPPPLDEARCIQELGVEDLSDPFYPCICMLSAATSYHIQYQVDAARPTPPTRQDQPSALTNRVVPWAGQCGLHHQEPSWSHWKGHCCPRSSSSREQRDRDCQGKSILAMHGYEIKFQDWVPLQLNNKQTCSDFACMAQYGLTTK